MAVGLSTGYRVGKDEVRDEFRRSTTGGKLNQQYTTNVARYNVSQRRTIS
jgi:hypothetical protein